MKSIAQAAHKAEAQGDRKPLFPEARDYDCYYLGASTNEENSWLTVLFQEISTGKEYALLMTLQGKGYRITAQRLKSFAIALCGMANEDEYNTVCAGKPDFIAALLGDEAGLDPDQVELAQGYIGAEAEMPIRVRIANGGENASGDWYRNPFFSTIEEG